MKKLILSALAFSLFHLAHAQYNEITKLNVTSGNQIDYDKASKYKTNGHSYNGKEYTIEVYRGSNSDKGEGNSKKNNFVFIKHNHNNNQISPTVEVFPTFAFDNYTFQSIGDKYYIIYSILNKKDAKTSYFAREIDTDKLSISSAEKKLLQLEEGANIGWPQFRSINDHLLMYLSIPNKGKGGDKSNITLYVYSFNENLDKTIGGKYQIDALEKDSKIVALNLYEDNTPFALAFSKENQSLSILTFEEGYKVHVKNYTNNTGVNLHDVKILNINNDELEIVAAYREAKTKVQTDGFFKGTLQENSLKKEILVQYNTILPEGPFIAAVAGDDGSVTFYLEHTFETLMYNPDGKSSKSYHNASVYVVNANSDGEVQWTRYIPKKQESATSRGVRIIVDKDIHYIIYIDHINNKDALTNEKLNNYMNRDAIMTVVTLNATTGEAIRSNVIDFENLNNEKWSQVNLKSIVLTDNNTLQFPLRSGKSKQQIFSVELK